MAAHNQATPLTDQAFAHLMQGFVLQPSPCVAVAVSGGPDSMALTCLLAHWIKDKNGTLTAFTVDHGLRDHSNEEAQTIHNWLTVRNISHHILKWDYAAPPTSAIHAKARRARYDLLITACHAHQCSHLFLAQHADDQAETVLMRFAKGSGLDGLAGMPALRIQDGITLVRPLLPVRKNNLIASCAANNWLAVNDPSNQSPRFARGRLRAIQSELEAEGLTTERLYEMAHIHGLARAERDTLTNVWCQQYSTCDIYGLVTYDYAAWQAAPPFMRQRLLSRALLCVSGQDYAPKFQALDLLDTHLNNAAHTQTLGGCVIEVKDNRIHFTREEIAASATLPIPVSYPYQRWDERFTFAFAKPIPDNQHIARLGSFSRDALEKAGHPEIAALPQRVRSGLPALFSGKEFVGLPSFGDESENKSGVKALFNTRRALIDKVFQPCPALLVNA